MPADAPILPSQRVTQICLFLFAAIALFGGALQMYLGEPKTGHGSTTCIASWPEPISARG